MLEEIIFSLLSMFASMNTWLTPTILFLLLNLIIFTIITFSYCPSSSSSSSSTSLQPPHLHHQLSILQRLKSLNFHDYTPALTPPPQLLLPPTTTTTEKIIITETHLQEYNSPIIEEHDFEGPTMEEIYTRIIQSKSNANSTHYGRQNSDTQPASGDLPVRLPRKIKKSASDKSAFNHFEAVTEITPPAVEEEVDSRADDFINKFKQQLEMQRMDSVDQLYKEMVAKVTVS